jgi:hypothetical protein
MVAHGLTPAHERLRREDSEFQPDPVSKEKKKRNYIPLYYSTTSNLTFAELL